MALRWTTERMQLRSFTADDVDLLVELDSDPEVMFFITGGRATPRSEIADAVLPGWLSLYERGHGFWAAETRSTGEFLGWFHLFSREGTPADEPELGYRLRRSAWGQGYATEGARALIDAAFEELGARRVVAHTMVAHPASRRVMEKAGMSVHHYFHAEWPDRIPGDEAGDVEYEITREAWETRRRRT